MRLQQTSEAVPAKIRIFQAVWLRVPKRRAGHREGPWIECAEPVHQHCGTIKNAKYSGTMI